MDIRSCFSYALPFPFFPRTNVLKAFRKLECIQLYSYETGISLNELIRALDSNTFKYRL
jgi:hypothetical protein